MMRLIDRSSSPKRPTQKNHTWAWIKVLKLSASSETRRDGLGPEQDCRTCIAESYGSGEEEIVSPKFSSAEKADTIQAMSLPDLLAAQAQHQPDALAILAPQRPPLTYRRLHLHMRDVVLLLRILGVSRHDRVALVLPNGPELAVACLTVAAGARCVPLNHAYSASDYDFFLRLTGAQALMIQDDLDSPARAVARELGLRVIELSPRCDAEAGLFTLMGHAFCPPVYNDFAEPHEVAFVLHTTGTTAQPKIALLSHNNILISAYNTRRALQLSADDRCLNVMPCFHAHGLMGALLTSIAAGASVVCTTGFSAPMFFPWLSDFHPTWYTAVPTIHQAILTRAPAHLNTVCSDPLRFIRSGSAPLPSDVLKGLETTFQAPVIEYYGMTEAASQITCNPLPPAVRKTGSVGIAAGPEVAVMDEDGAFVSTETTGEVVIRGANVIQGYDDPAATHDAFVHGWFKTGDQGFLDADGYLYI